MCARWTLAIQECNVRQGKISKRTTVCRARSNLDATLVPVSAHARPTGTVQILCIVLVCIALGACKCRALALFSTARFIVSRVARLFSTEQVLRVLPMQRASWAIIACANTPCRTAILMVCSRTRSVLAIERIADWLRYHVHWANISAANRSPITTQSQIRVATCRIAAMDGCRIQLVHVRRRASVRRTHAVEATAFFKTG